MYSTSNVLLVYIFLLHPTPWSLMVSCSRLVSTADQFIPSEPTLNTTKPILIPCHFQGCHWVGVVSKIINNKVHFILCWRYQPIHCRNIRTHPHPNMHEQSILPRQCSLDSVQIQHVSTAFEWMRASSSTGPHPDRYTSYSITRRITTVYVPEPGSNLTYLDYSEPTYRLSNYSQHS